MTFIRSRRLILAVASIVMLAGAVLLYGVVFRAPAVPAGLEQLDATVERGEYLATAGNCMSCHTVPEGEPYAGGREFHTPFGLMYSTNITADKEVGIGAWSLEDFYRAMKHGVRPGGEHLYPTFPYTSFAKLTDEDIVSLYRYMQSIEPVAATAPDNALGFPFNQRSVLAFWKLLFHEADSFEPSPDKSEAWNRGAYLVEGPAHCGACHTPRNLLGAERKDQALTGAVYTDRVKLGWYRNWSSANLTPSASGLGAWSEEDIADYLQRGENPHTVIHGPMNKVVVDSTRHLSDEDRGAIAAYLKGIPANQRSSGPQPEPETLTAGAITYTVHCGSCHLPTGLGSSVLGPPLAGNSLVQAPDPYTLINVILYGPELPPSEFVSDRSHMKMYGKRLSDEDIANVATYIRSSFGNNAGAVTPEQVQQQR